MNFRKVVIVSFVLGLFSPWMQTVAAQVSAPGDLPPGVTRRPVLEASLGIPPPGKLQVQERTRSRAGIDVVRHTDSALYYTLEGTHEWCVGIPSRLSPEAKRFLFLRGWSISIACCLLVLRCLHSRSTSYAEMHPDPLLHREPGFLLLGKTRRCNSGRFLCDTSR